MVLIALPHWSHKESRQWTLNLLSVLIPKLRWDHLPRNSHTFLDSCGLFHMGRVTMTSTADLCYAIMCWLHFCWLFSWSTGSHLLPFEDLLFFIHVPYPFFMCLLSQKTFAASPSHPQLYPLLSQNFSVNNGQWAEHVSWNILGSSSLVTPCFLQIRLEDSLSTEMSGFWHSCY